MPKDQLENFNRINGPRVEKMLAILNSIEKSARSQKIGAADVAALLAPVTERLNSDGEQSPEVPAPTDASEEKPRVRRSADLPPLADADMEAALEAVRTIRWGHYHLLAKAIPDPAVGPIVTQLVARMREDYAIEKGV